MSTPQSENVQIGSKVSIFCVATIIFQHCLNPLGHGVHQSFTDCHWILLPLLHDDITELVDVRDLRSSTFRLRMPYRCSIGALFLLWWLMRSNPVLLMNKAKALLYSLLLPLEGPIYLSHWLYQVSRECEDSSLSWSTLHTITSAL